MGNAYLAALYQLAKDNPRILAAVADNGAIVYDKFRADFPDRFINFGIAEATMISACAGLANCGKIPFAYTIIPFLVMRAYEQVRNDICLQRQNVKLIGVGGGLAYGALGPTHHALEDISILRVLPNMTIIVPASPIEVQKATIAAVELDGPVYIRLEATKEPEIYDGSYQFKIGHGVVLHEGSDVTIVTAGSIVSDALQAVRELSKLDIQVRLINMSTIKPIDTELLIKAAQETSAIITIEEHSIIGGLGGAVAEVLMESGCQPVLFERMGLSDFGHGYGSHQQVKEENGLSQLEMIARVQRILERKTHK